MVDKKIKIILILIFIAAFQSCYSLSYQNPENRQPLTYDNSQNKQNTQSFEPSETQEEKEKNTTNTVDNISTTEKQNNIQNGQTESEYTVVPKSFKSKILLRLEDNQSYTVKKGDTVYGISKRFLISWQDLLRYNNIDDPTKIKPGQKILIPSQSVQLYAPFETFSVEMINDHRIKIIGTKEYVYSLIDDGKVVFSGDVRGYGNSIIIQCKEYNIVLFGFDAITIGKDTTITLNNCLGITKANEIYMSIFQNEKILSLKNYF